jgi:LysM repeat protein
MSEMHISDFDSFRPQNRKPWLLLIVLLAVGGFFLLRSRRGDQEVAGVEPTTVVAEDIENEPDPNPALPGEESTSEAPAVTEGSVQSAKSLLRDARALEAQMNLVGARKKYLQMLTLGLQPSARSEVENRVGNINIDLLLTPAMTPEKHTYIVKRGDSVDKIARKFGTTVDLVKKSNNLKDANLIKSGDMMRIFSGQFTITISKARRDLVVSLNGEFFKRYGVGTGKFGKTPAGSFVIADKIKEPVWWRPDGREVPFGEKENILGTRWMKLRPTGDTPPVRGYGIHGTWDNSSIGKAASAGCVRMRNVEVEELFVLIPLGTKVVINE